jgi:hypothetical protein
MPIREIFYFIKEHVNELSPEEIRQRLREQGYQEDEIEEAFLLAEGSGVRAPIFKPKEHLPTLWQSLLEGVKQREEKPAQKSVARDFSGVAERGSFIAGLLVVPAFYFTEVLALLFAQLFYAIPVVDPIIPIGIAIGIGVLLYVVFAKYAGNFARGVLYGITALSVWFMINLWMRNFSL